MRYQRLFELRIQHAAYPDGRCRDLRIEPRAEHPTGVRTLTRHRLLARPRPQGLEILAQVDDGADVFRSAFPAANSLVFGFDLHVAGSEFATVTDLAEWAGVDQPYYRVAGPANGSLKLVGNTPVTGRRSRVAAVLEVVGITPEALISPPTFTLAFAAQKVLWVYYAVTKRTEDELPSIQDAAPTKPVEFTRQQLTLANTPASADPTGRRLLERHPGHRCYRFRSKKTIAIERGGRRQLALYLGDEMLIRELPLPSIPDLSLLTLKAGEPRQALTRVVEY